MTDSRPTPRYAARAARIAPSGAGHPHGVIMFGSGDAYPESRPDVAELARIAATTYRTETMQYAPRFGLDDLREWIVAHLAGEGIRLGVENVLVLHGAKQGIDLACKLFLDP